MLLYVVRHGVTDMNRKGIVNGEVDEPLIRLGIEQAETAKSNLPASI